MSFDWQRFLDLAEELAKRAKSGGDPGECEALARASIGRSYYSLYSPARSAYRARWGEVMRGPGNGEHAALALSLQQRSYSIPKADLARATRKLGTNLERLRVLRTKADYDDLFDDHTNQAASAYYLGRKAHDALRRFQTG